MSAGAVAIALDEPAPSYLDTPSTSPQDEHEKPRLTARERAELRDAGKADTAAALRAWCDANRWSRDLPAWAAVPIPVADYYDDPERPGRARRVVGGGSIDVPTWIERRARALEGCRDALAFRDDVCGGYAVQASSCHVRTCPDCEAQRQARAIDVYGDVAADRMVDPRFLTLTIRNVPIGELRPAVRELRRLVGQLFRRGLIAGGRCRYRSKCGATRRWTKDGRPLLCDRPAREHAQRDDGSWPLAHAWRSRCEAPDPEHGHHAARGGLVALEVTPPTPENGWTWHPHAHVLIDAPFIPWRELRAAWHEITARSKVVDPSWIVHVERVQGRTPDRLRAAVREVVKYATKPSPALMASDRAGDALAELLVALRGQRLVSTFGSLYGLPVDELMADDEPAVETVRVPDPDDPFRSWRLPRWCPHVDDAHGEHEAAWTAPTWCRRAEAVRLRAGPAPGALVWYPTRSEGSLTR